MKSRLIAIASTLLTITLVACTGDEPTESEPEPETEAVSQAWVHNFGHCEVASGKLTGSCVVTYQSGACGKARSSNCAKGAAATSVSAYCNRQVDLNVACVD